MLNNQTAYKDDLVGTSWVGEVVDIEDPQKIGRVRVKVYGKFDDIPTESIPWAYPGNNQTGGSDSGGGFFSVPKLGSLVSIKFDNGNIYHPEYFFNQKISDETKEEISNSYPNAHVLIYDTVTEEFVKVFFTEEKGLMFDYKKTQINIKPDKSIDIHTESNNSKILIEDDGKLTVYHKGEMKIDCDANVNLTSKKDVKVKCTNLTIDHSASIKLGAAASELAVLGNQMMTLFNTHTHVGNLGAPTSPPMAPMTPTHLSQKQVKVQ
jgi:hypothetical protein